MDKKENEEKPKLTKEQREKMKKYAIFALMCAICAGALWFIFAPPGDKKAKLKAQQGFNTDIPMPKDEGLADDKREAYEKEKVKQTQAARMRSLSDFSQLLGGDALKTKKDENLSLSDDVTASSARSKAGAAAPKPTPVQKSVNAYKDVNRTLSNFYETPKTDPEKEELKRQVEALKSKADESENRKKAVDEQMDVMEKSFKMAAKYMPGMTNTIGTTGAGALPFDSLGQQERKQGNTASKSTTKTAVTPVTTLRESYVSCLTPAMSSAEFMETYGKLRNLSFLTAGTDDNTTVERNTVSACISDNQTVMDGQSVRLRLLEPVKAGKMTVPANTCLSGLAKLQGERLQITVYSVEYTGQILPVMLSVYDLDGQAGVFIPDTKEINAVKTIAANMGANSGTSINLSRSAGSQILSDLGRNAIQGVSQFFSKKMQEVKVSLKAGYRVYLVVES